jgi:4-amino-4-deoxy-L-arabinose transferase-like glycosyltransferase
MYLKKIKQFIAENKKEVYLLSFIILIAFLLRIYRISEYLTFLGDEGRDVRIVRDILKGNLAFIGPQTSIGNMYLGPLYYYIIAPALLLSNLSPIGPAALMAIFGTLTVGLVWWVGRTWFNKTSGILAALLMTISPVAIIYSRSSWNPNPMPFFALLSIFGLYQVWQGKDHRWLYLSAISFAFAMQMHYLGLLLIPALAIFWYLSFRNSKKSQKQKKQFLSSTLKSIVIFLFLMSPLVLFDLKHQGMNYHAFKAFFTTRQTTINLNPGNSNRFVPVWNKVVADILLGQTEDSVALISLSVFVLSIWAFLQEKSKSSAIVLLTWLGLAILGLSMYKQHVYSHYFGFFWPAMYILVGWIISRLFQNTYLHKLLGIVLLSWLVVVNIQRSPLKQTPNNQLQRTERIIDLVIKESGQEPFNFGLIAKQNYDESYRYFLENKHSKMVRGEDGISDQLFVVCEDKECQPEGNPAWQVAIFGPANTVEQWQVDHIKIFKLTHAE